MLRAAAESARGAPSPEAPVGAVVVAGGAIVGAGHRRRADDEDAVSMALREAGSRARGATAYVTLEPGAEGVAALRRAGVARVVVAVADGAFGGGDALRAAGVAVDAGFHAEAQGAVERALAPWRRFTTSGRPHVTLKAAMSLDGAIATRGGESRWITSPEARRDGHLLRAACDAVLVGSATARVDDPLLTVRDVPCERAPARVVVSRGATLALDAKLVTTAREAPTWVVCTEAADPARQRGLVEAGVRVFPVAAGADGSVELGAALRALAAAGVVSVLCEGGGTLHGRLRDAGLVDRVVCYVAPMLMGGGGVRAIGGEGALGLADVTRLRGWTVRPVGCDLRVEAEVG